MRILAVDDDPTALALLTTTLRCAGHGDLTTAPSAAAALVRLARSPAFDCILLDIQMPGMDGIEFCRLLRQMPAHGRTPIIMISALADRTAIERAFAAGATDYVNKPFDPLELVVRVSLAERLCRQEQTEQAGRRQIDFLRSRLGVGNRIDIEDAFVVAGIATMVSPAELENHLRRMPRLRAWRSRCYTLRLLDAERHHEVLSSEGFYDLVADLGDAAAAALGSWPHVISYAGWGVFLIVVDGPGLPCADEVRDAVHDRLRALGLGVGSRPGSFAVEVEGAAPVAGLLTSLSVGSLVAAH